ncbi:MAG: hypothetical protein U0941_08200 [Planctomycetaceae bacterium]
MMRRKEQLNQLADDIPLAIETLLFYSANGQYSPNLLVEASAKLKEHAQKLLEIAEAEQMRAHSAVRAEDQRGCAVLEHN